jgi:hypothetical protein
MESFGWMMSIIFRIIFDLILLNIGYAVLKIITLGKYPKVYKDITKWPDFFLINFVGLICLFLTGYLLFMM